MKAIYASVEDKLLLPRSVQGNVKLLGLRLAKTTGDSLQHFLIFVKRLRIFLIIAYFGRSKVLPMGNGTVQDAVTIRYHGENGTGWLLTVEGVCTAVYKTTMVFARLLLSTGYDADLPKTR